MGGNKNNLESNEDIMIKRIVGQRFDEFENQNRMTQQNLTKRIENAEKMHDIDKKVDDIKENIENLINTVTKMHAYNVNRDVNLKLKIDELIKRSEENEEATQEGIKVALSIKDKIDKNYQILSEIVNDKMMINVDSKIKISDDDVKNDKMIDEIVIKCCEMDSKIDKCYQIIKENNVNKQKEEEDKKKKKRKNYENTERFKNLEIIFTKMEEKNSKIVNDLQVKN